MTSGRMKGQAFVSYSSTEEASEALKETNGYKLQDKPIVVVSSYCKYGVNSTKRVQLMVQELLL